MLITGGGSGIGRLMALEGARRGAEVIVWDLDEAAGARVAGEIDARGGRASSAAVDVSRHDEVAASARAAGDVDVVISNAGVVTGAPLLEASEEGIERTFRVNALAPYWIARAFLPGMLARNRGTVVTVASAAGLVGVARQTDYAGSKWAAVGFTESLRAELRAQGSQVRTLVVCPYYIDTGMFAGVRTRVPALLPILRPERVAERVIDGIERGREQIVMPPLVRVLPVVRALPVRAFDAVVDAFGVNRSMDEFTGRPADAPHGSGSDTPR
ncbi:SDR family oxidoreductase [Demequina sp. SYSU T00039]|uniref:SDR family oxidoreductase n=1 Tax=Demequina lignilytica TaxID=3051663 RepID=A0AAW7M3U6_9MICO|nr:MULTISPECIES: SDR family oxidoreductase [unclassified Demequina]MDN4478381.1 SDR family oxidoreductase [Demequina sp. SYSU T00039-1]MDN4487112.1 SDR family oxidoreductase [Demequina sp. SYSU T00039]MDN4489823.1 SDR family oxidoreductase [Demequina sp. SYSU T00068]